MQPLPRTHTQWLSDIPGIFSYSFVPYGPSYFGCAFEDHLSLVISVVSCVCVCVDIESTCIYVYVHIHCTCIVYVYMYMCVDDRQCSGICSAGCLCLK